MKKNLTFLLLLFVFSGVYSQKNVISGEQQVCPNREYSYTFTLANPAKANNLNVFIKAIGGKINGQESQDFNIVSGGRTVSFKVIWDDKGYRTGQQIIASSTEGSADQSIYVASFNGTTSKDHFDYGVGSSPIAIDVSSRTIRIPYMKTGNIRLSANLDTSIFPITFAKTEFKTSNYVWEIGSNKKEGGNSTSFNYGETDLDGTSINVYPVYSACDKKIYGPPLTLKIVRFLDAKITTTSTIECLNSNITYRIEGIPTGTTVNWTSTNNAATLLNGQGTTTATFKAVKNGNVEVVANISYAGKATTLKKDVWIGATKTPTDINGFSSYFNSRSTYTFTAEFDQNATDYRWEVSGGSIIGPSTASTVRVETAVALGTKPKYLDIKVYAINKCGVSSYLYKTGIIKSADDGPSIIRSISVDDQIITKSINIYNLSGILVYSKDNISGEFDIKSTTLPDGIYIIEKSDGKEKQSEKIILKR